MQTIKQKLYAFWSFAYEVYQHFWRDNAGTMGAGLAYFTLFSVVPTLIILITIGGMLISESTIQNELFAQADLVFGEQITDQIRSFFDNAATSDSKQSVTFAGVIALLFAATGTVQVLKTSINRIFKVTPWPSNMFRYFVINRLALFAAILSIGIFILATIVITSTLSLLGFYLAGSVPFFNSYILDIINNLSTFSLFVVAFTCTFKWLPDAVVSWRAAAFGGVVTGALFVPGKMAMQWFITGSTYDLYGAASSLVIFLVFLYYSAQIFFIGAESTYVFACRHGEKIKPSDDAIPFTIKEHVPKKHEAKDKKKNRG